MEKYNEYLYYESELSKKQRFRRIAFQQQAWFNMKLSMMKRGLKVQFTEEELHKIHEMKIE